MTVFGDYSNYYDLLYADKDYRGESEYIDRLIRRFKPGTKTILNLGCGTGRHDQQLADLGYAMSGVDISPDMIAIAKQNNRDERVDFSEGDVRSVRKGKKYDAVVSLFHVASYQVLDADLQDFFATASVHLDRGGLFIFDLWYGPAVLADPPYERTRNAENEILSITRRSFPVHKEKEHVIEVNFDVMITNKQTGGITTLKEKHAMRYLFDNELMQLLERSGLKTIHREQWLTGNSPSEKTWYVTYVTEKI